MLKKTSLSAKLIVTFIGMILLIGALNIYVYVQTGNMIKAMDNAYESNVDISLLQNDIRNIQDNLYAYLNGEYDSLKNYYSNKNSLLGRMDSLNDRAVDDEVLLLQKNIRGLCGTYLSLTDAAVSGHRGTDLEQYIENYEKARNVYDYLETYIYTLNSMTFNQNTSNLSRLYRVQQYNQWLNTCLIILASAIAILVIILQTEELIDPLSELAKRADELGHGNLSLPPLAVKNEDEVGLVTKAFNDMNVRLNDNIRLMQERLIEENRLKQEQLRLEGYLKDSKLGALQAQINPHFLYNTLNAGSQLAMMEDAEATSVFLEKVAEYFRYNLHKAGRDVSLEEELSQVENYIFIMNTRYAGAIRLRKDIPNNVPAIRLPGMVLQPIVENAIDHGIRSIEEGEKLLVINVAEDDERITVGIGDNGCGFPKDKAKELLENTDEILSSPKDGHGIGMANVVSRLRLFYDRKDIMEIDSLEDNMGTYIRVYLYKNQEK